jgi:hypothetical protein
MLESYSQKIAQFDEHLLRSCRFYRLLLDTEHIGSVALGTENQGTHERH